MKMIKRSLPIPTSQSERTLRILLPSDYENSKEFYRVMYLHDGQNLFEDETSYSGHAWHIEESLGRLGCDDMIVVGIDNSDLRLFEYSPWPCIPEVKRQFGIEIGGLGDVYARWVVEQLKPYIDHEFRTLTDDKHTWIGGSSMGAYISAYIATTYPKVFKHVGIFSLASWFNEEAFLSHLDSLSIDTNQTFFISVGRKESSLIDDAENQAYIKNSHHFFKLLQRHGVEHITYIETDDGHHELAWRKVFPDWLTFTRKKHIG